jgi:hypothetical protein
MSFNSTRYLLDDDYFFNQKYMRGSMFSPEKIAENPQGILK